MAIHKANVLKITRDNHMIPKRPFFLLFFIIFTFPKLYTKLGYQGSKSI